MHLNLLVGYLSSGWLNSYEDSQEEKCEVCWFGLGIYVDFPGI